jgi:hypothetical protein
LKRLLSCLIGELAPLLSVCARKMQMITNPRHPIWTISSAFGSTRLCVIRYRVPCLLSVSASSRCLPDCGFIVIMYPPLKLKFNLDLILFHGCVLGSDWLALRSQMLISFTFLNILTHFWVQMLLRSSLS